MAVGFLEIRVLEVQRPQDRERLLVRLPGVAVEIRDQLSAQREVLPHQGNPLAAVDPRHAEVPLARVGVRAVQAQQRAEDAELDPARIEVEVELCAVEAPDVVSDVGDEHVAAARGECDFVGEHRPLGIRVAGEERRITLASPVAVAAQDEAAPAALPLRVVVEDLVRP